MTHLCDLEVGYGGVTAPKFGGGTGIQTPDLLACESGVVAIALRGPHRISFHFEKPLLSPFSSWRFPNDSPSFDSARSFAKKIGEKRCLLPPRDFPAPAAALRKKENLEDVLK